MKKCIIFLLCVMVCSCVNEEKYIQEVKQMSHREIVFPNGYIELRCNSSLKLDSLLKQKLKIISYMDNVICSSCLDNILASWQDEIKSINENISYIIIVHSTDKKTILESSKSLSLDYPIMYYESNIFGKVNKLEDLLARNKTFLLDKDNKIILVGEPYGREKLSKLYVWCIDSLNKEYTWQQKEKEKPEHF